VSVNDPIGDMITRIRNAQMRGRSNVVTPASKLRGWVLDVLQDEGFIRGYTRTEKEGAKPEFEISLKYFDGSPAISEIQRVSKPGRRVYSGAEDLPRVRNGLGISIVTTPQGVMSDSEARKKKVGGEILCEVF